MSKDRKKIQEKFMELWDGFIRATSGHDHRPLFIPGTSRCFHCLVVEMDYIYHVLVLLKVWRAHGWNVRPIQAEAELIEMLGQEKLNEMTDRLTKELENVPRKRCRSCGRNSVLVNEPSARAALRRLSAHPRIQIHGRCYACSDHFPVQFFTSDFKEALRKCDNPS